MQVSQLLRQPLDREGSPPESSLFFKFEFDADQTQDLLPALSRPLRVNRDPREAELKPENKDCETSLGNRKA